MEKTDELYRARMKLWVFAVEEKTILSVDSHKVSIGK